MVLMQPTIVIVAPNDVAKRYGKESKSDQEAKTDDGLDKNHKNSGRSPSPKPSDNGPAKKNHSRSPSPAPSVKKPNKKGNDTKQKVGNTTMKDTNTTSNAGGSGKKAGEKTSNPRKVPKTIVTDETFKQHGSGKKFQAKDTKLDLWQEAYSTVAADPKKKKTLKRLDEIMRLQQQKHGKPVAKLRSEDGRKQMLSLINKKADKFESSQHSQTYGKVRSTMMSLKDIIGAGAAAASPFATIAVAGLFMVFETQTIYSGEKQAMFDTANAIANAIVRHANHEQLLKDAYGDDRYLKDLRRHLHLHYRSLYEMAFASLSRLITVLYSDWAALKLILKLDNWSDQYAAIRSEDAECTQARSDIRDHQKDKKRSGFAFCSRSPLHNAASMGFSDKVFDFISNDQYYVNEQTPELWTALMLASAHGHLKIVRVLLAAKGVKLDLQNKDGNTALHLAAKDNHVGVVKLLLAKKARIDVRNKRDRTAFLLAATAGKTDVIKALKGAGQDMNEKTLNLGFTGLHLAAENGRVETVRYMVANGADRDLRVPKGPDAGRTAKDLAEKKGKAKVVALLSDQEETA